LHGVAGVFKRGEKEQEEEPLVPSDLPSGQSSQPVGLSDHAQMAAATFPTTGNAPATVHEHGTLRVTVLGAKDIASHDTKPYVALRLGDKEFKTKHTGKTDTPEWNESFIFAASALTPKIFVWIHDHKTIGKDKELAEGDVDIWRHIKPETASAADVFVELKQGGVLRLRLEFDATSNPNSSAASVHSGERNNSMISPSRFSIRSRRPNDHDDPN